MILTCTKTQNNLILNEVTSNITDYKLQLDWLVLLTMNEYLTKLSTLILPDWLPQCDDKSSEILPQETMAWEYLTTRA